MTCLSLVGEETRRSLIMHRLPGHADRYRAQVKVRPVVKVNLFWFIFWLLRDRCEIVARSLETIMDFWLERESEENLVDHANE